MQVPHLVNDQQSEPTLQLLLIIQLPDLMRGSQPLRPASRRIKKHRIPRLAVFEAQSDTRMSLTCFRRSQQNHVISFGMNVVVARCAGTSRRSEGWKSQLKSSIVFIEENPLRRYKSRYRWHSDQQPGAWASRPNLPRATAPDRELDQPVASMSDGPWAFA